MGTEGLGRGLIWEVEGLRTPWGLLGKQILEGRNWAPGSAKGEEKETGQV